MVLPGCGSGLHVGTNSDVYLLRSRTLIGWQAGAACVCGVGAHLEHGIEMS